MTPRWEPDMASLLHVNYLPQKSSVCVVSTCLLPPFSNIYVMFGTS